MPTKLADQLSANNNTIKNEAVKKLISHRNSVALTGLHGNKTIIRKFSIPKLTPGRELVVHQQIAGRDNKIIEIETENVAKRTIINPQPLRTFSKNASQSISIHPISTLQQKESAFKKKQHPTIVLSAGIAVNQTIKSGSTLQPYPVAELKYNINDRFFFAAGITAWSPVANTTSGRSKTIYLNDTINNIEYFDEITTYKRLRYTDIPITVGVNITKNICIQAGAQLSILVNKKKETTITPYDFQRNSLALPGNMFVFAAPGNSQQQYDVAPNNIDPRLIAAIRYTYKKAAIGITYQHALQSVSKRGNDKPLRNHLVGLNLLYQLK